MSTNNQIILKVNDSSNNTTLYILLIVIVILIGLGIWYTIKKRDQQNKQNSKNVLSQYPHIQDPDEVATTLEDTFVEEYLHCPEQNQPPCAKGFNAQRNQHGEICCYIDPKSTQTAMTEIEIFRTFAKQIAIEFAITDLLPRVAIALAKGTKAMIQAGTVKAAGKLFQKQAAKVMAKVTAKVAAAMGRTAVKQAATAPAKAAMGPVGWAMLAFDVMSLALDVWDPEGYNSYVSDKVALRLRNITEMMFENMMINEGSPYPLFANYYYKHEDFYDQSVMPDVIDKAFTSLVEELTEQGKIESLLQAYEDITVLEPLIMERVETYTESDEFEKDACEKYRQKYKTVKWINGFGCSLNERECSEFNNKFNNLPENEQKFALYTNKYRTRDKTNPGDNENPNMIERTLPTKACIISPLFESKKNCKNKGDFDIHNGLCNFSRTYCSSMGLRRHKMNNGVHNCVMYPGQEVAEMFLGTTVNRYFIRMGDKNEWSAKNGYGMNYWGPALAYMSMGPMGIAMYVAFKHSPELRNAVGDVNDFLSDSAKAFYITSVDIANSISFKTNFEQILSKTKHHFKEIKEVHEEMQDIFDGSINAMYNWIEDTGQKIVRAFGRFVRDDVAREMTKAAFYLGKAAVNGVEDLIDAGRFLERHFTKIGESIRDGIVDFTEDIADFFNDVFDEFTDVFKF